MIGELLKNLIRSLFRFVGFHAKRAVGKDLHPEKVNDALVKAPDPFPLHLGRDPNGHSPLPEAPRNVVPSVYEPVTSFDWQALGAPEGRIYLGGPSISALDLLVHEPRFALDVGCSNGDFASLVKQQFPQAQIWGIEPNKNAAKIAAARIDRVLDQTIEEVDWTGAGVQRGEIDTVFLFDVLEHVYNPWKTLLTMRNLVSATAQLIVSIPNVRNVLLIQDLISGYWRYRPAGLLDITHIRFFTQKDMYRMFYQTGFRVIATASTQCPKSAEIFQQYSGGKFPKAVELKSASITVDSIENLVSLCAVQHMFTLQPAEYEQLSAEERRWTDVPHPPTMAYASG